MAAEQSNDDQAASEPIKGVAPIKREFLVLSKGQIINWDFVPDDEKNDGGDGENKGQKRGRVDDRDNPDKRFKLKGQNKSKQRYKLGKKAAQNKNSDDNVGSNRWSREKEQKSDRLCLRFMEKEGECQYNEKCVYSHDLYKIHQVHQDEYFDPESRPCFIYSSYGRCQFGAACLFAKSHSVLFEDQRRAYNLMDHNKWSLGGGRDDFLTRSSNRLDSNIQHKLRKKNYDFKLVSKAMTALYRADVESKPNDDSEETKEECIESEDGAANKVPDVQQQRIGAVLVDEFRSGRDYARKNVDFKNKLFLAPLTTVGNLPFRRLCKKLLCDITAAEMSLCSSLLNGNPTEWSHVKRHSSEDVFGIQITANHPEQTTKVVKLLNDTCDMDFIDLNCGCPTEFIYQSGAGAGLMNRPSKLRKMLGGAAMVSNVPITVKMRAGCSEEKNTAHNLCNSVIRPFTSRYIGAITIHGRSRNQRYSRLADWNYINECGRYVDDIPLLGSGDCISWQDYYKNQEDYPNVSGVMIARGALISPWLFTEIKERRTWDISSRERLDLIKDYVNFALDHWGSDATGIENSRRYLLEWLSFACRYIPVGLLERLPQKINERPPKYRGRDELETLLSSPAASDWVKISEMFLGKVPDDFKFLPKHKANAYESVTEG